MASPNDEIHLSRGEVQEIADDAAAKAVRQVLLDLGVDHQTPLEMQHDFQHLRQMRLTTEAVQRHSLITLVGLVICGAVAVVLIGFKAWMSAPAGS